MTTDMPWETETPASSIVKKYHQPSIDFGLNIRALEKCRKLMRQGLMTVSHFRSRYLAADDMQSGVAVPNDPAATPAAENG